VHKTLIFIDSSANFQSRNNMNTLKTITTIHVMRNTELTMIQTLTKSGFSCQQRERETCMSDRNNTIATVHCDAPLNPLMHVEKWGEV
jgi:hypothetical protein